MKLDSVLEFVTESTGTAEERALSWRVKQDKMIRDIALHADKSPELDYIPLEKKKMEDGYVETWEVAMGANTFGNYFGDDIDLVGKEVEEIVNREHGDGETTIGVDAFHEDGMVVFHFDLIHKYNNTWYD